ncbi:MAG: hypothetical protein KC621_01085 [Myxococcales bacterium]|nr:hypothetical protein [Myxococcales bacterium]
MLATLAATAFGVPGCQEPEGVTKPPPETVPTVVPTTPPTTTTTLGPRLLSDDELLTRISMDLRGVRPTVEELDRYAGDPEVLDELVDEFLHDERFLRHLEDLWSELFLIRIGDYFIDPAAYEGVGIPKSELMTNVSEEPLRMLSYLADNDLPYSEYVLGNWTVVPPLLAAIWPVDFPEGATGWTKASYNDDRPGVGVLSTNGTWWFKGSMINNRNRGRANYVSRIFLCDDYLEREVPFVPTDALDSEAALGDAINTNPGCTSCHATLDPLASHFYGWFWDPAEKFVPDMIAYYHTEREFLWRELTGTPPGYFGKPTGGLVNLGTFVSEDPRYAKCFVKNAWELTTRTDADTVEVDLSGIDQTFADSNMNIREVFRSIVMSPEYQGYDERFHRKKVAPELLSSMMEDLTGYAWTLRGDDLVNTRTGYALLAGAADGDYVTVAAPTSTVTSLLVTERLAESSARFVARHDADEPERILFDDDLTFTETTTGPGADKIREQLQHLYLRMYAKRVASDDPELEELVGLWTEVHGVTGDVVLTWSVVLSAMLRDPDLVMY